MNHSRHAFLHAVDIFHYPLTYGRQALEMAVFYNSSDLFGRDMAILGVSALIAAGGGVLSIRRGIAR